jgi:hypothetical protein
MQGRLRLNLSKRASRSAYRSLEGGLLARAGLKPRTGRRPAELVCAPLAHGGAVREADPFGDAALGRLTWRC